MMNGQNPGSVGFWRLVCAIALGIVLAQAAAGLVLWGTAALIRKSEGDKKESEPAAFRDHLNPGDFDPPADDLKNRLKPDPPKHP